MTMIMKKVPLQDYDYEIGNWSGNWLKKRYPNALSRAAYFELNKLGESQLPDDWMKAVRSLVEQRENAMVELPDYQIPLS